MHWLRIHQINNSKSLLSYGPHIGVELVKAKVLCKPLEFDLSIDENKIDVQGLW